MKENEKYEKKIVTEFQKMMMETTTQNTKNNQKIQEKYLKIYQKLM